MHARPNDAQVVAFKSDYFPLERQARPAQLPDAVAELLRLRQRSR